MTDTVLLVFGQWAFQIRYFYNNVMRGIVPVDTSREVFTMAGTGWEVVRGGRVKVGMCV